MKSVMVFIARRTAVLKGKELKLVDTQTGKMLVTEGEHTDEEVLEMLIEEKATPRHVVATNWSSATWSSDVQEIFDQNFKDIDSSRDPAINLEFATREEEEIAKAYSSFPGFKKAFEDAYRLDYDSFAKINRSLVRKVVNLDQHVYYGTIEKLLEFLKSDSGLSKNECRKVVESMTWRRGDNLARRPIYSSGLYRYTSYRRLSLARGVQLESLFLDVYHHEDEKGRMFEESCRELLRKTSFRVYPGRLIVPFQIVPTEVSEGLWGKAKMETDIDVIAASGRFAFILECKESKIPYQRLIKKTHLFEKYLEELYHKVLWIQQNRAKFTELLGSNGPALLDGVNYLVPLVVTTFPFDVGITRIALMTHSELGLVAKSADKIKVERVGEEDFAAIPWRVEEDKVQTLALKF